MIPNLLPTKDMLLLNTIMEFICITVKVFQEIWSEQHMI
jgi:hypothetical protein